MRSPLFTLYCVINFTACWCPQGLTLSVLFLAWDLCVILLFLSSAAGVLASIVSTLVCMIRVIDMPSECSYNIFISLFMCSLWVRIIFVAVLKKVCVSCIFSYSIRAAQVQWNERLFLSLCENCGELCYSNDKGHILTNLCSS